MNGRLRLEDSVEPERTKGPPKVVYAVPWDPAKQVLLEEVGTAELPGSVQLAEERRFLAREWPHSGEAFNVPRNGSACYMHGKT